MAKVEALGSDTPSAGAHRMAFALIVSAVGTASLLRDAWPKAMYWPSVNLHTTFGVLLCLMVFAQFHAANQQAIAPSAPSSHAFCRGVTRLVFLMLYVLFGANELVHVAATLWNKSLRGGAQPAILQPPESLRVYLAYGVVALILIRVLGAWAQRSPSTLTLLSTALRSR